MSIVIDKPSMLIDKCSKANQSYKICLIDQLNSSLKLASFNRSEAKIKTIKMGAISLVAPCLFTVGESRRCGLLSLVGCETGLIDIFKDNPFVVTQN